MINPNPSPIGITRFGLLSYGTPCGNRTHNCPLGGDRYIHLTKEAYIKLSKNSNGYNRVPFCRAIGDCERRRLSRHIHLTTEAYIKLFSVKRSLRAWCVKSLTERFPLTIFNFTTIRVYCQSQ